VWEGFADFAGVVGKHDVRSLSKRGFFEGRMRSKHHHSHD
jgi:hypothetical protein